MTTTKATATATTAVIITGGGGFLGQCLAAALLKRGCLTYDDGDDENAAAAAAASTVLVPIRKLILADIAFPDNALQLQQPELQAALEDDRDDGADAASAAAVVAVQKMQGDVSDASFCESLYEQAAKKKQQGSTTSDDDHRHQYLSVFHLGAVMSGDGERDFDLCMRVNLHGCIHMLEGARHFVSSSSSSSSSSSNYCKFVFCSAGAIIGAGSPTDYVTFSDIISDATRATPHTTYGATKACCELLVSDYARRQLVDARGLRLPTIVVRAGIPNAATTSCYSSVIREPLAGTSVVLPIDRSVRHAVTGQRAAINALLTLHDAPTSQIESVLGYDRTIFLPAVALSLGDLEDAMRSVITTESLEKLGTVSYKVDANLSKVVGSFPTKIDASRAIQLGIPPAPNAETLVREYMEDFASAVANGIVILMAPLPAAAANDETDAVVQKVDNKVAVITGGGSGIGRAFAQRLSQGGGWAVVLAGRRLSALQETQKLLNGDNNECLCVQTDVTVESQVKALFSAAVAKYGRVDLLFNNAGINTEATSFEDVSYDVFNKILQTNVCGPFLAAREAMKVMAKNGGGRIINNGSLSAQVPRPGSACYTTSKHAMLGLTKCIALDGRKLNVACGQVDFGNVVSELSLRTNKAGTGALQANGTHMVEPSMTLSDATESLYAMANLPLDANVLQMTVMATKMPFVGRG